MNQSRFTEEQKRVINLTTGEHLVLAPPGTGKTEVLAERIANALRGGVSEEEIACFTFTNRAAANMSERVSKILPNHKIFIGNIHSWCSKYLFEANHIPKNTTLLDEEDARQIANEIRQELGISSEPRELLKANTHIKQNRFGLPKSLQDTGNIIDIRKDSLIKFCDQYETAKAESVFLDFDDLLILAYSFLSRDHDRQAKTWLQVDEAQDLNALQWALIDLICERSSHRVYFGDYNQSIFSFMGARPDLLSKRTQQGCAIHSFSKNFRSPEELIRFFSIYADAWLGTDGNTQSLLTPPATQASSAPLILRGYRGNQFDEAKMVTNHILANDTNSQTAILVASNLAADLYANMLEERNTSYFKVSGFDIFKRKEIKDLFAFFQSLINNEDRISWARVLWLHGGIATFKQAREVLNDMFDIGMRPMDIISEYCNRCDFLGTLQEAILNGRVVIFDTETTGLDVEHDDIIQIAAIEIVNGRVGDEINIYIDSDLDLTESFKVHRISKSYLRRHSTDRAEAFKEFRRFAGSDTLIAHNANFDKDILFYNLKRHGIQDLWPKGYFVDSIDMAKRLSPRLHSYKLKSLLDEFELTGENLHNALEDVRATASLVLHLAGLVSRGKRDRAEFAEKHSDIICAFRNNYQPLHKMVVGEFSNEIALEDVTTMVFDYNVTVGKGKENFALHKEISKITAYMRENCKLDKLINNIKKWVPLFARYTEVDLAPENEKIFIATIHKAKGLEFDNVVIPQVVDGIFPSFYAKTRQEKQESARLLYVAMTRAKQSLMLTFHTSFRSQHGAMYPKKLSEFIRRPEVLELFPK